MQIWREFIILFFFFSFGLFPITLLSITWILLSVDWIVLSVSWILLSVYWILLFFFLFSHVFQILFFPSIFFQIWIVEIYWIVLGLVFMISMQVKNFGFGKIQPLCCQIFCKSQNNTKWILKHDFLIYLMHGYYTLYDMLYLP